SRRPASPAHQAARPGRRAQWRALAAPPQRPRPGYEQRSRWAYRAAAPACRSPARWRSCPIRPARALFVIRAWTMWRGSTCSRLSSSYRPRRLWPGAIRRSGSGARSAGREASTHNGFDDKEQPMRTSKWLAPAMLGLALVAACNENGFQPSVARSYNQVQRLGNPLVSEVFLAKRSHPVHGSVGPDRDVALISAELKAFVANVAGRNATVQNTLA